MAEVNLPPSVSSLGVRPSSLSPPPRAGFSPHPQTHIPHQSSYSYSSPRASASSTLYRLSLSRPTPFSSTQAWMDGWVTRVGRIASRPETFALFMGGGSLLNAGRAALSIERVSLETFLRAVPELPTFSMASSRWRWAALPGLGLTAAGCVGGGGGGDAGGIDGQGGDASPDGGVIPVDQDGDGFPVNTGAVPDCNDNNPNIHPLRAGGTLHVSSSVVICPGLYHGARIVVDGGTSGINVIGTGVTMDGDGMMDSAIRMDQVNLVNVRGFNIYDYPLGAGTIYLTNSDNNIFRDMTVEAAPFRYAFYMDNSDNNTLDNVEINSHSDSGVYAHQCAALTVRMCTIQGVPPFDAAPDYGLLTIDGGSNHRIEDSTFRMGSRYGLQLYNVTNASVLNNQILDNMGDGLRCSNMKASLLQGNTVNGNGGYGLSLNNGTTTNTISVNNFTLNDLGALFTDTSSSSGNTFSGNTPPP